MLLDRRGVDTLPMRLVCYATLATAIAWLAASGLQSAAERQANDAVLLELDALFARLDGLWGGDAARMYSALPSPGASVQVTLALPPDTWYLAFGADPGAGGFDPLSAGDADGNAAFLSTDALGLHGWALAHPAQFGVARPQGGQLLPPTVPLVVEGGGEVALRFTLAFDPVDGGYWVLCERL